MIMFTGIEKPQESYKLFVKMSSGLSVGISNGWSRTVIVAPGVDENWGDVNITRLQGALAIASFAAGVVIACACLFLVPPRGKSPILPSASSASQ